MGESTVRESASDGIPLAEVRQVVTEIWERCLERKAIGINVSFFDLGGNSLSAMYITALINEAFSMDIPFQAILELKDIASVADYVFRNAPDPSTGPARVALG